MTDDSKHDSACTCIDISTEDYPHSVASTGCSLEQTDSYRAGFSLNRKNSGSQAYLWEGTDVSEAASCVWFESVRTLCWQRIEQRKPRQFRVSMRSEVTCFLSSPQDISLQQLSSEFTQLYVLPSLSLLSILCFALGEALRRSKDPVVKWDHRAEPFHQGCVDKIEQGGCVIQG